MDTTSLLKEIDGEIARLQSARTVIAVLSSAPVAPGKRGRGRPKGSTNSAKPKKRKMSPEGRARIAAAMKKRWAAKKKAE